MLAFTELVFDQIVRGNVEVFSSPKFDELLGSAYDLIFEPEVEESTGTAPTLQMKYHHSNSGKGFIALSTLISATSIDVNLPLPYRNVVSQSGPTGKLGRIGIQLGGSGTLSARVRVWAIGRMRG